MQIQTVGFMTIQTVANDGVGKAQGMCHVDTKLVGTTCLWPKSDEGVSITVVCHFVVCDGATAVFLVYHLPRSVVGIGTQGKVDDARLTDGHGMLQKS